MSIEGEGTAGSSSRDEGVSMYSGSKDAWALPFPFERIVLEDMVFNSKSSDVAGI